MATLQDRLNINSQMEHLQSKHVGTGNADTTRFEWAVNMHRDTAASLVGHHYLTSYLAVAENEAPARVAFELKQRMLLPCGLRPVKEEEGEGAE